MADFVHLHLHTTYSMLDGACQIRPLVDRVKALGMKACAITDHGSLFGVKHFYDVCRMNGVKPILGCETYVASEPHTGRTSRSGHHLVLLAKNLAGYRNLVKLISLAHTEGFYYSPRIDKALLERHHEGLICSSACIAGEIPSLILKGREDLAEAAAGWFRDLFGGDFYLEVMRHVAAEGVPRRAGEPPLHELEERANAGVESIGRRLGIKTVMTNDVHFLNEDDAEAHDVLLCLSTGKKLADERRLRYSRQEWFKTYDEMIRAKPDAAAQLENTLEVAEKVEPFELDSDPILPVFPIPESFGSEADYRARLTEEDLRREFGERYDKLANGQGPAKLARIKFEADYLAHLTELGAAERWPGGVPEKVRERIAFELQTIKTMGFPGYFLIVRDYIAAAREMGVLVGPGRGSAAGSVVAYCLKITNVDPTAYGLLFERFLNPDRISMPDIDVDFDDDGRKKVLDWVTRKYGTDHVAHIVTFGQMAPKSAIRDVARVMDVPLATSNRLAGLVPNVPKISFDKAVQESPELAAELQSPDPQIRKVLALSRKLDGSLRQPGVHACGVIISRDPLVETIPVMPTEGEAMLTTQYDGHYVEPIGLLKMDFLGLKTLTVIKECLANLRESRGLEVDIDAIPLDDKETYALFSRGETTGLFQFESEGMKKYLRELKPNRLEDLVAMNALYRPGPMKYIPQFIARKHGREPVSYDHPLMEKYLKGTYGICVYQEQVMLLSRLLGGFTGGQSDTLRKAMGKKKLAVMEDLKARFEKGCLANPAFMAAPACRTEAAARALVDKIWDDWRDFASYAFNKSHAVCYAYVAYQTGYLKAHYPVEFMCAQISSEIGNFDKLPGFVAEAADMNLQVLPPDVNRSLPRFAPSDGNVRYGLAGIKGVGEGAAEAIVKERRAGGPFKSFPDFCERMDAPYINRRVVEALVKSGAFDSLGMHRARLFANIDLALSRAAEKAREKASGQISLFENLAAADAGSVAPDILPDAPEWPEKETLLYERELLGLYMTGHPLDRYKTLIKTFQTRSLLNLDGFRGEQDVRVAGLIDSVSQKVSKKTKELWAILKLDNGEADIEVLVFSNTYRKYSGVCSADAPVLVCGSLTRREGDDRPKIIAQELYPLLDAPRLFASKVVAGLPAASAGCAEQIARLKALAGRWPGTVRLMLCIIYADGRKVLVRAGDACAVDPSPEFMAEAESFLGRGGIKIVANPSVYREARSARRWSRPQNGNNG